MEVGGHRVWKLGDGRVAVADFEVAEHLVVGAVLLDDVDHVLDVLVQKGHGLGLGGGFGAKEIVVRDHAGGERAELCSCGHGNGLEAGLGQLPGVLVGGVGRRLYSGRGVGRVLGVGTGVAFAIDDVEQFAVGADAYGVGVKACGDEAGDHAAAGRTEPDDRDGVFAAVGDIKGFLIGRKGQRIGVGTLVGGLVRVDGGRRRDGNLVDDLLGVGIDHGNGVAVVLRDIEQGLGLVHDHFVGVAGQLDAGQHAIGGDVVDLAVADAGDIGDVVALELDPERVFAARYAGGNWTVHGFAGAQVEFAADRPVAVGVGEHADRVVFVVGDQQAAAVGGDGYAGRFGRGHEAKAAGVAGRCVCLRQVTECDGLRERPGACLLREDLHVIRVAAGDEKGVSVGGKDNAAVAIGDRDGLLLERRRAGNIEHKDPLGRVGGVGFAGVGAVGVILEVVAAGQDQQRFAVGADGGGDRLADGVAGIVGKAGIQRFEAGTLRSQRRDPLPG